MYLEANISGRKAADPAEAASRVSTRGLEVRGIPEDVSTIIGADLRRKATKSDGSSAFTGLAGATTDKKGAADAGMAEPDVLGNSEPDVLGNSTGAAAGSTSLTASRSGLIGVARAFAGIASCAGAIAETVIAGGEGGVCFVGIELIANGSRLPAVSPEEKLSASSLAIGGLPAIGGLLAALGPT